MVKSNEPQVQHSSQQFAQVLSILDDLTAQ